MRRLWLIPVLAAWLGGMASFYGAEILYPSYQIGYDSLFGAGTFAYCGLIALFRLVTWLMLSSLVVVPIIQHFTGERPIEGTPNCSWLTTLLFLLCWVSLDFGRTVYGLASSDALFRSACRSCASYVATCRVRGQITSYEVVGATGRFDEQPVYDYVSRECDKKYMAYITKRCPQEVEIETRLQQEAEAEFQDYLHPDASGSDGSADDLGQQMIKVEPLVGQEE